MELHADARVEADRGGKVVAVAGARQALLARDLRKVMGERGIEVSLL